MNPLLLDMLPWVRQGYCCSQLLLLLALRQRGEENASLLRAAQGLCHGLGQWGGPCGLLTGGATVLGLLAGRGAEGEAAHPYFDPCVNDYAAWFAERTAAYGGQDCPHVVVGLGGDSATNMARTEGQSVPAASEKPNPLLCGELLAQCWDKIVELSDAYQLDWDR